MLLSVHAGRRVRTQASCTELCPRTGLQTRWRSALRTPAPAFDPAPDELDHRRRNGTEALAEEFPNDGVSAIQPRLAPRHVPPADGAVVSTAAVALAAICWGLSGGIGALLMSEGWDALVVSFYRGATGLAFVAVWLILSSGAHGLSSPRLWGWSALAGVGVAGNFLLYFTSIAAGSVAVAATLMYCAPVFVLLVSFALRLERATPGKWVAIAIVLAGITLLTGVHDVDAEAITAAGVGAGLLAGLCYAVFIFGFKFATPHGSPPAILAVAFSTLVVVLVALGVIDDALAVPGTPAWPVFALLGVLGGGVSFVLYVVGLNNTAPAVAAMVAMVEPVTASLFGAVVLDERLTATQLLGLGLVLVTVTALSVRSSAPGDARRRGWLRAAGSPQTGSSVRSQSPSRCSSGS